MWIVLSKEWVERSRISPETILNAGTNARCCLESNPSEAVGPCLRCGGKKKSLITIRASSKAVFGPHEVAAGALKYCFNLCRSGCSSSRDHLRSRVVLVLDSIPGIVLRSPPLVLRSREKPSSRGQAAAQRTPQQQVQPQVAQTTTMTMTIPFLAPSGTLPLAQDDVFPSTDGSDEDIDAAAIVLSHSGDLSTVAAAAAHAPPLALQTLAGIACTPILPATAAPAPAPLVAVAPPSARPMVPPLPPLTLLAPLPQGQNWPTRSSVISPSPVVAPQTTAPLPATAPVANGCVLPPISSLLFFA